MAGAWPKNQVHGMEDAEQRKRHFKEVEVETSLGGDEAVSYC